MSTAVGRGPTVRRRRLISELRRQRELAEMTQEQVAEEMDWSLSKLIRVESGAVGISTNDLRALLQLYGVTDRRRTNEMIEMAKAARQRMWWNEYRGVMPPAYMTFVGFEAEAVVIRAFHLNVMPGLLQTKSYASAIDNARGVVIFDKETAAVFTAIRAERGRQVLDRDDPPEYRMVLDEAVIRRQVGGADVMNEQIAHLVEAAKRPNVRLCVIPFERGDYVGAAQAAFTIFEFADSAVGDVLYLGAPGRDELREAPSDIEDYQRAFVEMESIALSPEESIDLIEEIRQEFVNR